VLNGVTPENCDISQYAKYHIDNCRAGA
jgi:hypothetical protein